MTLALIERVQDGDQSDVEKVWDENKKQTSVFVLHVAPPKRHPNPPGHGTGVAPSPPPGLPRDPALGEPRGIKCIGTRGDAKHSAVSRAETWDSPVATIPKSYKERRHLGGMPVVPNRGRCKSWPREGVRPIVPATRKVQNRSSGL